MSYNILIVDDSVSMRTIIKRTVGMTDLAIGTYFEAGDGHEALDILNTEWIDLVLADVNMPGMNGIEMIERIHENPEIRGVPIIIISTEASATRLDHLREIGVKGYIHKPFTPEQIKERILEVLGITTTATEYSDHD